jgi:undecaprenyl-diphosphatase
MRFLQRAGVLPEPAERAVDRFIAGSAVAAVLVAVATLVLALVEGALTSWQAPEALLPSVVLGLGAWGLVLAGRFLADRGSAAPSGTVGSLAAVRRAVARRPHGVSADPRRWGAILGWSAVGIGLEAAALASAVHAVGSGLPLLESVSVYAVLHMLWTLVPVTAAPGAADVALLLMLTALGAPLASACAAVVVFRLLVFWVPAALGSLFAAGFERRLFL